MKIAVFIKSTTLHASYGGLETQNKVLCEGLVKRGHAVTVFTPCKEHPPGEENQNGITYVFIPASYRYFLSSLNSNSWERKSIKVFTKYQSESSFDLVISQSTGGIGIIKNKENLGVKVISIAHGTTGGELQTHFANIRNLKDLYWALRNLQYSIRQYFGRQRDYILHADCVVAVSNAVKAQIIDETFAPQQKIEVIHNGINLEVYQGVTRSESFGPVRLIYTGRVVKSKGLFDLADALAQIKDENWLLDVIGDGEDLDELKTYTSNLGLSDKIIYQGKVSHEEVMQRLFNADVYVLPTKRVEGFPMTLVEAMFAELAIVAADIGGVADAVEDENTGYLINPGNIESLKNKLLSLIKDKNLRINMGRSGKIKALNEFTADVMLDKYEQVMKGLIS